MKYGKLFLNLISCPLHFQYKANTFPIQISHKHATAIKQVAKNDKYAQINIMLYGKNIHPTTFILRAILSRLKL